MKHRILGLAVLGFGLFFGTRTAGALAAAVDDAERIYQSVKLFVLVPLLLVLGAVLLFGGRALEQPGAGQRRIVLGAAAAAVALGAGGWLLFGPSLGAPGVGG